MKPVMVYIYALDGDEGYFEMAHRFMHTYQQHPPLEDHDTLVVCNGSPPTFEIMCLLGSLPNCSFMQHDDTGQDIGGFIAAAKTLGNRPALFCGGSVYFHRPGWLKRMMEAWSKHGPGMYGSQSTYEATPHMSTTGFLCPANLMAEYPHPVATKKDRYNFEHGMANKVLNINEPDPLPNRAFWRTVHAKGMPVKFVAWGGEYDWWEWRNPPNIYRRGDQTNLLMWWRLTDHYASDSDHARVIYADTADKLVDPNFDIQSRSFK